VTQLMKKGAPVGLIRGTLDAPHKNALHRAMS
jgi:hypothetical protein